MVVSGLWTCGYGRLTDLVRCQSGMIPLAALEFSFLSIGKMGKSFNNSRDGTKYHCDGQYHKAQGMAVTGVPGIVGEADSCGFNEMQRGSIWDFGGGRRERFL